MKSYLVIYFLLSSFTLTKVQTEKTSNLKGIEHKSDERTIAAEIAPNRTQNIKQALELQIFPTGITGQIYINLSILTFVVIGYTLGGAIYTFFNTYFGVQNAFMDANFGPVGSLAISLRWAKNLILAIFSFILLWSILAPNQSYEILRNVGFNEFKEFAINEKLPIILIREFVTDALFAIIGFSIYWMIARTENDVSANPMILFLRVFGLQDPNGNSRSIPDSEEKIYQGYNDLLQRTQEK